MQSELEESGLCAACAMLPRQHFYENLCDRCTRVIGRKVMAALGFFAFRIYASCYEVPLAAYYVIEAEGPPDPSLAIEMADFLKSAKKLADRISAFLGLDVAKLGQTDFDQILESLGKRSQKATESDSIVLGLKDVAS